MHKLHFVSAFVFVLILQTLAANQATAANGSIGGFIPFVGVSLTDEYKTLEDPDVGAIFFIADPSNEIGGEQLGTSGNPYYDIAILDTGAASHILTHAAFEGFNLEAAGFRGTQTQDVGGAGGLVETEINDALGVYVAGLGDRTPTPAFAMDTDKLRGQTSFATLTAPEEGWNLPNIIGMPMAAQHALVIRNDLPQIFQHDDRTMRTPQVVLRDLGTGGEDVGPGNTDIVRRTTLKLKPGLGFVQGPLYVFNLGLEDILGGILDPNFELDFHDNPSSPSVVENGGLFVDVDLANGALALEDKEFLFDTGADLSVISQLTAKRLGFDPVLDTPDFYLEVEGVGGVSSGIPGIFLDTLNIDTVGGSFTLHNVPVAVLDLPNPSDPGNTLPGLIGMQPFNGRNLVIDANPAIGQGGDGPSLYISDPVTQSHSWSTAAATGNWSTAGSWSVAGTPAVLWDANVAHVSGGNQTAVVSANSAVFRFTVSGTPTQSMTVKINAGVTLTTFADARIEQGGRIELAGGKLDTQFVEIAGGTLTGTGDIFAGTGPIHSPVRNLSGRVEPGSPIGQLSIDGDFSQQIDGTLAIDLAGALASQYDRLAIDRFAFLGGTLEVKLLSFTPAINATFTILTATEGVVGEFDDLFLPPAYDWEVIYGDEDVVLKFLGAAASLDGDFNSDGVVDAADYVWLRKFGNTPQNESMWRSNFGESQNGSSPFAGVPEPSAATLAFLAACGLALPHITRSRRLTPAARSAA